MGIDLEQFKEAFKRITDNDPLSWQRRLYSQWMAGDVKSVIDLPTGMGKTSVIPIWLIARAHQADRQLRLPTRLIYVVDRRTVVDQATDHATKLADSMREHPELLGPPPAISTLRGQLADNREWSRDPSKPAIIIGTVDLIGSALLFSGYRSSMKRRPLEAGLLGQDSLLILDEAHLSKPFEKLACAIQKDGPFQKPEHGRPVRVVRMSATSAASNDKDDVFSLEDADFSDPIIAQRWKAKKTLTIKPLESKAKLIGALADTAINLAQRADLIGKRIVVFARKPDQARAIAERIRSREGTKNKPGPYANAVEVLTGTMRGLERDQLVEKEVFKQRWLNGGLKPENPSNKSLVFLVSTSAGEVGFDLNGDHLIGDVAPLDSWIQRLGRVNRRGEGDAQVVLVKEANPPDKTDFEKACIKTTELFQSLNGNEVGPEALAAFKADPKNKIDAALSPIPPTVELTDILLDAWSMTSITGSVPGRPEVAPWLRGIEEKQAQVTIAWRAELDLFAEETEPAEALNSVFTAHRVRPHESMTVNVSAVLDFLSAIKKGAHPELLEKRVAVQLSRSLQLRSAGELLNDNRILYSEPMLIFPASFGGLDRGMLSADHVAEADAWLDVADQPGYEPREDRKSRRRIVLQRSEVGWKYLPYKLEPPDSPGLQAIFDDEDDLSRPKISQKLRAAFRLRTVQVIKFANNEEGEPQKLLLLLAGISPEFKRETQSLSDHVKGVECEARRIAQAIALSPEDVAYQALTFAAKWHDHGKDTPTWQRFIGGPMQDGTALGKSDKYCDPRKLCGYRHEFGSLLRLLHPDQAKAAQFNLPADQTTQDLALHLIAAHHGFSRPHFDAPIDRDFHSQHKIDAVHADCLRRFARLQRKYGWWYLAWLENLLRCADQIASAGVGNEEVQEDETEVNR